MQMKVEVILECALLCHVLALLQSAQESQLQEVAVV